MLIDSELVLEAAMDISATAEAAVTKDTGGAGASEGHKTYARFMISTAPTAGTFAFHVSESSDDSTFTAAKSSRTYGFAELVKGKEIKIEVPADVERYIGAGVVVDTGTGGVAHVDFFHG